MEEYETEIHNLTIDPIDQYGVVKMEHDAKFQVSPKTNRNPLGKRKPSVESSVCLCRC